MPALSNSRHEAFAQELAKGLGIAEAYEAAGYTKAPAAATRLAKKVNHRVVEIQAAGAERAEITVETICRELEEDRQFAKTVKQAGAAVSATMGKAKVSGLLVDRTEVKAEVVHDATPRELARAVFALLREAQRNPGKEIDHVDAAS